jgi:hypothetical protein
LPFGFGWILAVCGIVDFGGFGPAAGGVHNWEFGGDLDAAAAAGVEVGVKNVGANVLVVVADQGEVSLASVEGIEPLAICDRRW